MAITGIFGKRHRADTAFWLSTARIRTVGWLGMMGRRSLNTPEYLSSRHLPVTSYEEKKFAKQVKPRVVKAS